MRLHLVVAAVTCAGLLIACASLSGADNLFVDGDDAGSGSTSGTSGTATSEGGSSSGEAGGEDPPLAECATGVCVPTSDGWSPAVRRATFGGGGGGDSCPDTWPTRTAHSSPETFGCSCTCTSNAGSCEGPLSATQGGFTCGGVAQPLPSLPGDGGCVATRMEPLSVGAPFKITASPTSPPTACSGVAQPTGGGVRQVSVCTGGKATASAMCPSAESCVPRAGGGYEMCVVHDGSVSCPSGFGRRTEITTGEIQDARTCSTCTCGVDCSGGRIEAFFDEGCKTSLGSAPSFGQCQISNVPNGSSFRYSAGNGCRVAQNPTVTGNVTVPDVKTLCCARD